jgi:two-component system, LytTR family, response regulator
MASEAKIRTIIVDDEGPARARIRQLLKPEADFTVIGECANGGLAVELIQREKPDLAFLDVQMPRLSGLEVCQRVAAAGTPLPMVIFVTAYDAYALKAFEVHAIDYLLKPFDQERFNQALTHARRQFTHSRQAAAQTQLAAMLEDLAPGSRKPERLVFKENGRIVFIRPESIDWVEADGNYIRLHGREGSHYVRETLANLETQLPAERFMRISRSIIVNLDRVKELEPMFYGDYSVILQDGSRLSMSRTYRDRLESIVQKRR